MMPIYNCIQKKSTEGGGGRFGRGLKARKTFYLPEPDEIDTSN